MSACGAASAAAWRVPPWLIALREISTTVNPAARARSAVPSVDDESITMTSSGLRLWRRMPCERASQLRAAFNVGIISATFMGEERRAAFQFRLARESKWELQGERDAVSSRPKKRGLNARSED